MTNPKSAHWVSSDRVRRAIDAAEVDLQRCWAILRSWKEGSLTTDALFEFQPILGGALLKLEETYLENARCRESLAASKGPRSKGLAHRLRLLDKYSKALEEMMKIGRSIGDAVAWFFYQKERDKLRKHLAHPAIRHFPTGVGGRGEIEFIRNSRVEGHFLLHHGITSFLRIGDVSFINPHSWTVSALGEVKSRESSHGKVLVNLYVISDDTNFAPKLYQVAGRSERVSVHSLPTPEPKFRRRLEKQLRGISATLSSKRPDSHASIFDAYYVKELTRLAERSGESQAFYMPVGQGGLLAAVRPFRSRKISSRLFAQRGIEKFLTKLDCLVQHVTGLCDPSSGENTLLVDSLSNSYELDKLPLFWWPINLDFLKRVYFGEIVIISIYNPVHLFKKLRESGFEIQNATSETPSVTKVVDGKICEFKRFEWFLRAVHHGLWREERIIETLNRLCSDMIPGSLPAVIELDFAPCL